jgi:hypothetical protein
MRPIRYMLGQAASDKICRNEVVTIDTVDKKNNTVTLQEHADRYGPWRLEDFVLVADGGKHLRKGQRVVFAGEWGTIVDTMKETYNEGSHKRTIYMVKIEFDNNTESWQIEDDTKMGETLQEKAKLDKMVQVIKSAKNPTSEFYRTINQILKR